MPTIWVSRGHKRFIGGTVNEDFGEDITDDVIVVAFSSSDSRPPDRVDAIAPTSIEAGATDSSRIVKLLIDNTFEPAKDQHLWAWVSDEPEVEPVHLDGPFTIA